MKKNILPPEFVETKGKEVHSTLFGFQDDVVICSYVAKKNSREYADHFTIWHINPPWEGQETWHYNYYLQWNKGWGWNGRTEAEALLLQKENEALAYGYIFQYNWHKWVECLYNIHRHSLPMKLVSVQIRGANSSLDLSWNWQVFWRKWMILLLPTAHRTKRRIKKEGVTYYMS